MRGAERLAQLLNQVRDLGGDWPIINDTAPKGGNAEEWAKVKIATAVIRALGLEHDPDANAGIYSLRLADPVPLTDEEKVAQRARCRGHLGSTCECQEEVDRVTRQERARGRRA